MLETRSGCALSSGKGSDGLSLPFRTENITLVDPAGFEPAISCVQSRRLPTRPRAHDYSRPVLSDWLPFCIPAIEIQVR